MRLTEREFMWAIWIIVAVAVTAMTWLVGPENGRWGWRWDF